jgi:hypothetical protein
VPGDRGRPIVHCSGRDHDAPIPVPADLAHAITAILDDASLAARLGGHGHALARERCSAAGMAAEHESLYRSLTGFDARPSASRGRV